MNATIQVILLTGFLGSGKTTFLNRLIAATPPERKLLILVNEFGEIGIDGTLLEKNAAGQDFEVIELNKGSIFCACIKADFITALLRIAQDLKPDLLVMEATGVANPADLRRDLALPAFRGVFELVAQICLLDARHFIPAYNTFVSLEKQLESSTCFIINKTDLATPEDIAVIRRIVESHHPAPLIFEAVRCAVPLDEILGRERETAWTPCASARSSGADILTQQLRLDPFREMAPPDRLVSIVMEGRPLPRQEVVNLLHALSRKIVRGKGFFKDEQGVFLAELVMGSASLSGMERLVPPDLLGKLVCILPPEARKEIADTAAEWGLRLTGPGQFHIENVAPPRR